MEYLVNVKQHGCCKSYRFYSARKVAEFKRRFKRLVKMGQTAKAKIEVFQYKE